MPSLAALCRAAACALVALVAFPAISAADQLPLVVDLAGAGGRCDDDRAAEEVGVRRPLCTIERAVALSPRGGMVLVRRGSYPALRLQGARPRATVTIAPYGAERPRLRGFDIQGSARLRIERFRIGGLGRIERSELVTVEGNDVTPHGFVVGDASRLRFVRNHIHDLTIDMQPAGVPGSRCHTFTPAAGMAPHCGFAFRLGGVSDTVIAGNEIDHVPADGLQGTRLTRLEIRGNHFHDISAFVDPAEHSDAIQLIGANASITVRANRFQETRGLLAQAVPADEPRPGTTTGLVVRDNAFFRITHWPMHLVDTTGAQITGNTVWNAGRGIRLTEHPEVAATMTGVVLSRNVLDGLVAGPEMFEASHDNVIVRGPLLGPGDSDAEPAFADAEAGDLRLLDGRAGGAPATAGAPPAEWITPAARPASRRPTRRRR